MFIRQSFLMSKIRIDCVTKKNSCKCAIYRSF